MLKQVQHDTDTLKQVQHDIVTFKHGTVTPNLFRGLTHISISDNHKYSRRGL